MSRPFPNTGHPIFRISKFHMVALFILNIGTILVKTYFMEIRQSLGPLEGKFLDQYSGLAQKTRKMCKTLADFNIL